MHVLFVTNAHPELIKNVANIRENRKQLGMQDEDMLKIWKFELFLNLKSLHLHRIFTSLYIKRSLSYRYYRYT